MPWLSLFGGGDVHAPLEGQADICAIRVAVGLPHQVGRIVRDIVLLREFVIAKGRGGHATP